MSMEPILPDYKDRCVSRLIPSILDFAEVPSWVPVDALSSRTVVLLVLDGLGWHQLQEHKEIFKTLPHFEADFITTVAPSTTATALTSITTGAPPGEHGIVGYRIPVENGILNSLRWSTGAGVGKPDPFDFQLLPVFDNQQPKVITSIEHEGSGFSKAHLRNSRFSGYRDRSELLEIVIESVENSEPFVYVYWDGIDRIAHEFGFTDRYLSELEECDAMIAELLERLPSDVALLVTSDHGQVEVGDQMLELTPTLNSLILKQSGEARFRWLHARPGAEEDLYLSARERFGNFGWVMSKDQILNEGWFGPKIDEEVKTRLGDVALVAREKVGFTDPAEKMPFQLITRHGSLTKEEMHVPLLSTVT